MSGDEIKYLITAYLRNMEQQVNTLNPDNKDEELAFIAGQGAINCLQLLLEGIAVTEQAQSHSL